jgi:hypothetical protein
MPLKSRFVLVSLFLLLAALLAVWFTPFAVSHGVRWWIWWRARQEGFTVNVDKIDAPFLRPVAIRQLRLTNAHDDTFRVDLTITDALFDLNFKHILLHRGGRAIRNLSIRELHAELRRANPSVRAITRRGWATLHRMLPENLSITGSEPNACFAAKRISIRESDRSGPFYCCRGDDRVTVVSPDVFAIARCNALGS